MPRVIVAVHVFELPMIFIFYEKAIQKYNNAFVWLYKCYWL